MNNQPFPTQHSILDADALAGWLAKTYHLREIIRCQLWRAGICDAYQVITPQRRAFLKVYRHGRRTRLDVSEEVRLLTHLAAHDIPVAAAIPRRDGDLVSELAAPEGMRVAALFMEAEGEPLDPDDPAQIATLGETVARLHAVADTHPGTYRRAPLDAKLLLDDNLDAIRPFMAQRPEDLAMIESVAEDCRASMTLPRTLPQCGICHGDLHGGDVLFGPDGRPTLFDFDSSGVGWRAHDLGVFLASNDWMNTTPEAEDQRQSRLASLIEGYSRVRTLGEHELAAIQRTPPIRHIFLMGHVLRWTTAHQGWHWANDGFIDWHMDWFRWWAGTRPCLPNIPA